MCYRIKLTSELDKIKKSIDVKIIEPKDYKPMGK